MRLSVACLAVALAGVCPAALATGGSAAPAEAASAAAEGKAAVPARKGFQDPMERLRERLAEKLGGGRKIDGSDPGLVRIVNRGSATPAGAAAPSPRRGQGPARGAARAQPRRARVRPRHPTGTTRARAAPSTGAGSSPSSPPAPAASGRARSTSATASRCSSTRCSSTTTPAAFASSTTATRCRSTSVPGNCDRGAGSALRTACSSISIVRRKSASTAASSTWSPTSCTRTDDGRLAVVAVLLDRGSAHPVRADGVEQPAARQGRGRCGQDEPRFGRPAAATTAATSPTWAR